MITQASSEHTISVGIDEHDKNKAVQAINKAFENEIQLHKINPVEVEDELAIVALVGSNMKNQVGVAGKMFNSLGRNGVSIKAIAQGSSERNISVVIENHDLKKAVNVLHETFFTGEIRRINLFIVGVGNVGSALLTQIKNQINYLKKNSGIELRVVGLANSRKMLIDSKGISLESWTSDLYMSNDYSIDNFIGYMSELNLRNSLFIDITASHDIADRYVEILKESISVVTPNKIAATSPFQHYQTLKFLAKKFSCQFLFETNVCAGLPVISTLNDLVKSGDRIHSIEGVFSGTLNFIFNQYNGEVHFSDIVKMAKSEGYTEPDPRLDLSGSDVMRKILILVRESGLQIDFEDVQNEEFVPEECMKQDVLDDFFDSLERNEEHFRKIYQDAESESKSLRYVASWDRESGIAKSGLKKVGPEHPFYNLEGKDNIVVFYTDRYREQPLIIKGAGAGADVTASGIFADIMRVANSNN